MTGFPITHFLNIVLSFIITYVCIPPIIKVSKAKHLFDRPDHRKLNKLVVPTLGGIGIFIGLSLSTIIFVGDNSFHELRFVFGAMLMLFFIGLKDDILVIAANKKLIVQMGAAFMLVVLGGIRLNYMHNLFGFQEINVWLSYAISFMIVLFLINAINLIDGIDGLAGGLVLFIAFTLGCWFLVVDANQYAVLCFALSGSLLAFLRFNLWGGLNKIFMGDTGSLILGLLLAVIILKFMNTNYLAPYDYHIGQAPTVALSFIIIPVTDTLRVFFIRLYQRRSPFSPDMNHIHHLLIRSGMTHIQATSFLIFYTATLLLLSLTIQAYVPVTVSFMIILSLGFITAGLLAKRTQRIVRQKESELKLAGKIRSIDINREGEKVISMNGKRRMYQH